MRSSKPRPRKTRVWKSLERTGTRAAETEGPWSIVNGDVLGPRDSAPSLGLPNGSMKSFPYVLVMVLLVF